MNINRSILFTILFFFGVLQWHMAMAQTKETFSYIYIQGDKETPFYVKFEDEMLPRYGKNYSIISELAPGPVNLQILFQQNKYPAQKFVVQVPENGFRGFLLMRKGDVFSLYDIHQQFYLPAGNKAGDDHLPVEGSTGMTPPADAPVKAEEPVKPAVVEKKEEPKPKPAPKPKPVVEKPKKEIAKEPVKETPAVAIPTPPTPPFAATVSKPVATPPAATKENKDNKEPAFLDNISLDKKTTPSAGVITKPARGRMTVTNSDCPEPINDNVFADLEKRLNDKFGEDKLKYLFTKMDNCYSTAQVRTLARRMDTDAERYTLLKRIYPRVSDQSAFPTLEREFTETEWKNYFHSILNK